MVRCRNQLLAAFGLLAFSHAWEPTAKPNRMLKARQDCTAPCGNYNQWYTPLCCSNNWICITDVLSSAKCGPVPTVATVQTTLVQTNTVTATPTAQSTQSIASTPSSRSLPTSAPRSTTIFTTTSTPTVEPSSGWSQKKTIAAGAGGGGGALVLLAAAIVFFIWHKKRKTQSRESPDRDGAGSMMARVSPRVQSRQELREMRDEAAEEVAPPRYDNSGPNPFSSAAFARDQANKPSHANRGPVSGLFNELPATARSADGESERLIPRRAVGEGAPRHSNIGPVPPPPPPRSSRGALRPDHDFSAGR